MNLRWLFAASALLIGCASEQELQWDAKLDAPLRDRIAELRYKESREVVDIQGKCVSTIDGYMRQALMDAGADVVSMANDVFAAQVLSSAIPAVASLDFVVQLELLQISKRRAK